MNTITEYQKQIEERKIIKEETRTTILMSVSLLIEILILGVVSYFLKSKQTLSTDLLENIRNMSSLGAVLLLISILWVRRTLYYSPRFIKEGFTLTQVLRVWRSIDLTLMAITELLPICGLVLSLLGAAFDQIFHFFVGGAIMIVLLTPMGIKVRSKLSILRETFPGI
jgi:hypothetical protein